MGAGRPSRQPAAQEWLEQYLGNNPKGMRFAEEIKAVGAAKGFGWLSLKRAKKALGYRSMKSEISNGGWLWYNPHFIPASQANLAEQTAQSLDQIEKNVGTVIAITETRQKEQQEARRAKNNAKAFSREDIQQLARTHHKLNQPLLKTIALVKAMAENKPMDPPLTEYEIHQLVADQYGVPVPDVVF
jgi:hypothetical protein